MVDHFVQDVRQQLVFVFRFCAIFVIPHDREVENLFLLVGSPALSKPVGISCIVRDGGLGPASSCQGRV